MISRDMTRFGNPEEAECASRNVPYKKVELGGTLTQEMINEARDQRQPLTDNERR